MKKVIAITLALIIAMMMFTACGSPGMNKSDSWYVASEPEAAWNGSYDYGWDADMEWAEEVDVPMESTSSPVDAVDPSRKIIKNGSMRIETLDFDRFIFDFEASVSANGGYIESSSQTGNSAGHSSRRNAYYTVRIPSAKYEAFISKVGELGTVTQSDTSTEDVTLQYVDIEARLKALTAERDSFMALMDRAKTIEEILEIQRYLTDVNYQIESYTSQLNTLKSLVTYSTVSVSVWEVERVTAPEPKTVWERISTNLDENLYNIGEGAKDLFVAFVSSLPYLVILAVFVGIILLIVFGIVKSSNKKQAKRQEEYNRLYGYRNPDHSPENGETKPNADNN